MRPRAFIVMPYDLKKVPAADGAQGKELEVDFNRVYNELIKPAVEQAGCKPFRADEEPASGDIRIDMFFELVTADVVVADVSILSTNVFYELGVRHGVSPRGAILLHAGWTRPPFDNAPDRMFKYDGHLFVKSASKRGSAKALKREQTRLQDVLRRAMDADDRTVASPVYAHLPGLQSVDWRDVQTARSRYFGNLREDWSSRVRIAKRNGRPEDILTLAEAAPTRFHQERMQFEAADALLSLERFDAARMVLEEFLREQPRHLRARSQLGLVLGRLKKLDEATELLTAVNDEYAGDSEAQGALGRACKDLWRLRWEVGRSVGQRQALALRHGAYLDSAVASYRRAHERHPDSYYNGVNLLTLTHLIEHAARASKTPRPAAAGRADLAAVVDFVTAVALRRAEAAGSPEMAIWARGTLGELAIVRGQAKHALKHYRWVADAPDVSYFHLTSMLSQLQLYAGLGCETAVVTKAIALLQRRQRELPRRPTFDRVFVAAEVELVRPGATASVSRSTPTVLPPSVVDRLREWQMGRKSLAICSARRGAELLFAAAALKAGATVRVLLPLEEGAFIRDRLRVGGERWVDAFLALRQAAHDGSGRVTIRTQPEFLGTLEGMTCDERNEHWVVNTARVESTLESLHTLVFAAEPSVLRAASNRPFVDRLSALSGGFFVETSGTASTHPSRSTHGTRRHRSRPRQ
jgi:tetratricopeptide (TPR) repeat protein